MNDADQLLLEWAEKKIKPWLADRVRNHPRNAPDERFWRDKESFEMHRMAHVISGAVDEHLLNCSPRVYGIPGHDWECGCYSEYTRDDQWTVHAYITCHHGLLTQMVHYVNPYDMPEIIQELAQNDGGCAYDDPDW